MHVRMLHVLTLLQYLTKIYDSVEHMNVMI